MIDKIHNVSALSFSKGLDDISSTSKSTMGAQSFGSTALTPGQNTGVNFSDMLASMATNTVDSIKGAEAMSFAGMQGKANTREVVDAVLEAQQSLQTALALRDKVVNAYLEISKMQI